MLEFASVCLEILDIEQNKSSIFLGCATLL